MSYRGIVRGRSIELEEKPPFAEGTTVDVTMEPARRPRTGSPRAVLELAGTLTAQEAADILQAARESRTIDLKLWRDEP
jgi:hypothetical protein